MKTTAEEVQDEVLARAGDLTGVALARETVKGEAGPELVKAAHGARLLVVGSRSFGALRAALLGSVSRYCAQHAPCPVVVVGGPSEEADTRSLVVPAG